MENQEIITEQPKKEKKGIAGIIVSFILIACAIVLAIFSLIMKVGILKDLAENVKEAESAGEAVATGIGVAFASMLLAVLLIISSLASVIVTIPPTIIGIKRLCKKRKPLAISIIITSLSVLLIVTNILLVFCFWS